MSLSDYRQFKSDSGSSPNLYSDILSEQSNGSIQEEFGSVVGRALVAHLDKPVWLLRNFLRSDDGPSLRSEGRSWSTKHTL